MKTQYFVVSAAIFSIITAIAPKALAQEAEEIRPVQQAEVSEQSGVEVPVPVSDDEQPVSRRERRRRVRVNFKKQGEAPEAGESAPGVAPGGRDKGAGYFAGGISTGTDQFVAGKIGLGWNREGSAFTAQAGAGAPTIASLEALFSNLRVSGYNLKGPTGSVALNGHLVVEGGNATGTPLATANMALLAQAILPITFGDSPAEQWHCGIAPGIGPGFTKSNMIGANLSGQPTSATPYQAPTAYVPGSSTSTPSTDTTAVGVAFGGGLWCQVGALKFDTAHHAILNGLHYTDPTNMIQWTGNDQANLWVQASKHLAFGLAGQIDWRARGDVKTTTGATIAAGGIEAVPTIKAKVGYTFK